jgi:hypothetical protein
MTSETGCSSQQFWPGGEYSPPVPTWESVLQYPPGARITDCAGVSRYLQALAEGSDRVRREVYGKSWEGRDLQVALVGEPGNLARLEAIRARIARLADPRRLPAGPELEALVRETPPILWVGANVHGGEHSSAEAALLLAYQLAAGEDVATRAIRERTIVVIDPLQNPDGRERSVAYFYGAFGLRPNPDPNAAEHHAPWPGSRGNHYLFDLNRDWIYLTQKETIARVDLYLQWRPQVFMDLHEMGTNWTYYFPPPAPPLNVHHPEITRRWWETFGRAIAALFDREGVEYYVRESFDSFFPGYGEAWPSYHGAVGMTFEQATVQGLSIRRKDETLLTLAEAIRHHFLACMAVCVAAAERAEELLRDFYHFHRTAIAEGAEAAVREYLLPARDAARWPGPDAAALATLLARQGVEVGVATTPIPHPSARPLHGEAAEARAFPAGTLVVRLDQPAGRLARSLLEAEPHLDEEFVQEELERRVRHRDDRFYDVTSWSLADTFGVEVWCGTEFSQAETVPWSGADRRPATGGSPAPRAENREPRAVAYLLEWGSFEAACCLAELLEAGVRAHVSREPFEAGGRKYDRGTIVISRRENGDDLAARLGRVADRRGVRFHPAAGSWTDAGISLGSPEIFYLKPPKAAVLYDQPASTLSFGWLAYLLEQRAAFGFTALRRPMLADGDLRDYNVIVLPDGSDYPRYLDEAALRRLKAWVESGGVLIALRGAAAFLAREPASPELRFTTSRLVTDLRKLREVGSSEKEGSAGKQTNESEEPVPREHRPDPVPGALLRTVLDPYHPLCYGLGEALSVLATSDRIFTPSRHGWNAARFAPAEALHVSGFLWERMRDALAGQAYLVDEPTGRGHVLLFAEDPNFRGAWTSLSRLFLNALFFLPSVPRG